MGWSHYTGGNSRQQLIEQYTKERPGKKLLKKCFRGNPAFKGVLWTVWEILCNDGQTRRVIGCDLFEFWNIKDARGWAVKSMDETMGPHFHHCPLSYLEIAKSFAKEDFSKQWRERVKYYHAKKLKYKELEKYKEHAKNERITFITRDSNGDEMVYSGEEEE